MVHESVSSFLSLIHEFLKYRGLDHSPTKSKYVVFDRRRRPSLNIESISIDNTEIPQVSSGKFLGVILDCRLNGKEHLNFLIKKSNSVANINIHFRGQNLLLFH